MLPLSLACPPSTERGTYTAAQARFWPWLSVKSPECVSSCRKRHATCLILPLATRALHEAMNSSGPCSKVTIFSSWESQPSIQKCPNLDLGEVQNFSSEECQPPAQRSANLQLRGVSTFSSVRPSCVRLVCLSLRASERAKDREKDCLWCSLDSREAGHTRHTHTHTHTYTHAHTHTPTHTQTSSGP